MPGKEYFKRDRSWFELVILNTQESFKNTLIGTNVMSKTMEGTCNMRAVRNVVNYINTEITEARTSYDWFSIGENMP